MLTEFELTVLYRLIEGAHVEMRQNIGRLFPGQPTTLWPDFGMSYAEARRILAEREKDGISTREAEYRPDPPTAAEISRADECILWRAFVEGERDRKILMDRLRCYVTKRTWSKHCRLKGWTRQTVDRRVDAAIKMISLHLRKGQSRLIPADEETLLQLLGGNEYKTATVAENAA